MKKLLLAFLLLNVMVLNAQRVLTPPMGYMTWNNFGLNINEANIKKTVDLMVASGLRDAGYNYLFIDDGWQGGRDNTNRMIPDPKKFPSGMKALADYIHARGMKVGIYSDAAPLTCGGLTGSLNFEELDAKTFAEWDMDYLKYDYCGAPADWQTAIKRYETMSDALNKSGRNIVLSICEWGDREPWYWGKKAGGNLWRTTADIRDKWISTEKPKKTTDLHRTGAGIMDIVEINAELAQYAAPGAYNDPDMLLAGLYGKNGPAGELGGKGCTDTEYQSQMSLWCLMSAPLMISLDLDHMNAATKRILMNRDIIAVNQDPLGKQAVRMVKNEVWQVFVKPLSGGAFAVGFLNTSETTQRAAFDLSKFGIYGQSTMKNLWTGRSERFKSKINITAQPHETVVYRVGS